MADEREGANTSQSALPLSGADAKDLGSGGERKNPSLLLESPSLRTVMMDRKCFFEEQKRLLEWRIKDYIADDGPLSLVSMPLLPLIQEHNWGLERKKARLAELLFEAAALLARMPHSQLPLIGSKTEQSVWPESTGYTQQEAHERTTVTDNYRSPEHDEASTFDKNNPSWPLMPSIGISCASAYFQPGSDQGGTTNGDSSCTLPSEANDAERKQSRRHHAPTQSITTYNQSTGNRDVKNLRKALAISINSHEVKACPDSGSSENVMREDWASNHNLKIRRTPRDRRKLFELGNGKLVRAAGRACANVEISRAARSPSRSRKRRVWFYIFENCPVPIILGMPFLESEAILTTNQHLLETCPKDYGDVDSICWIGSPRTQIRCSLDGQRSVATADTGSDLNLMSLDYAKRSGYWIDDRPEVRRRLQFGDGSVAETMGQVYVSSFSLDWRSPSSTLETAEANSVPGENPQNDDKDDVGIVQVWRQVIFHVLPGLPCDILLGRPLLEAADAFNRPGVQLLSSDRKFRDGKNTSCLNIIIEKDSSKWFANPFRRRKRAPPPATNRGQMIQGESSHHDMRHAHWYSVAQMKVEIESLTGRAKRRKLDELATLERNWEMLHKGCAFCT